MTARMDAFPVLWLSLMEHQRDRLRLLAVDPRKDRPVVSVFCLSVAESQTEDYQLFVVEFAQVERQMDQLRVSLSQLERQTDRFRLVVVEFVSVAPRMDRPLASIVCPSMVERQMDPLLALAPELARVEPRMDRLLALIVWPVPVERRMDHLPVLIPGPWKPGGFSGLGN